MSAQRGARTAVEASHRSIHPNVPGVPWWGALLIAVTATAAGYAVDAWLGHKELTHVFAVFYIAGCVLAVLAVRQEGVFTAIIQPPLILFFAVPGAYWLFHGRKVAHLKDLLINCGYPLIERFPLMLGTAGGVLLIGLVRWYFGLSFRAAAAADTNDDAADADAATPAESRSFFGAITGKLNSLLGFGPREKDSGDAAVAKRARASAPPRKAASSSGRPARGDRSARPSRAHSRHARRAVGDEPEPAGERPRRRRPAPPGDVDPADAPRRPRRRPVPKGDADRRDPDRRDPERRAQPREARRDPRPVRNPYEWPFERTAPHSGRFDDYDRYEPPHEPQRRRGTPGGNGDNSTHHPISRVRYRRSGPLDEAHAEPGAEHRSRPRARRPPAESWEYDV